MNICGEVINFDESGYWVGLTSGEVIYVEDDESEVLVGSSCEVTLINGIVEAVRFI